MPFPGYADGAHKFLITNDEEKAEKINKIYEQMIMLETQMLLLLRDCEEVKDHEEAKYISDMNLGRRPRRKSSIK